MRTFSPRLRASAALLVATGAITSLSAVATSAYAATPTSSSASVAQNNRAESLAEQAFAAATNTGSSTSGYSSTGSTASGVSHDSSAASLAQGAYDKVAGNSSTSSASTSSSSSSSSDAAASSSASYSGSAQSIAAQIVPADQLASFDQIISHESGWDVTATNASSGAYGLAQSLPGDKMASAGSDWQTNPATQIRWALSYMNSTYGSPNQAWTFWQSHNWY